MEIVIEIILFVGFWFAVIHDVGESVRRMYESIQNNIDVLRDDIEVLQEKIDSKP